MVQPHAPPRQESTLEIERILMTDFISTQAHATEVAPPASWEEGQAEATMVEPLSASPLLTSDGVDKMCRQQVEIHAIVDISNAALQAHRIVNVALHREYSSGIVFIFSQGRKDLYYV
jgi:hypothetical protein